jgi:hypothetical protein
VTETAQPVVTPANGAATPAPAAAANAPDELDQLLKQFETPAETPKTESKADTKLETSDIKDVVEYVRAERTRKDSETVRTDIEKARSVIRSQLDEIGVKVPDIFLEGSLDAMARKDPRIAKAWMQREKNPQAWTDVLTGIAKTLRKDFESLPDKEATDDKNAVRLAVRSASTRTPEPDALDPKKLTKMSDAEFNKYKRELRGG